MERDMEHEDWREQISLASDGRLADSGPLNAHLADCAECRLFAKGVEAASQTLSQAQAPAPSEEFIANVLERLPQESGDGILERLLNYFPEQTQARWFVPAFSAALAVAVLVWTPVMQETFAGPDSLVAASFDEEMATWGEGQ
jgi:hypothetical protein